MIPLVRIHAESDAVPSGIEDLATAGMLHLLQLDYARPRLTPSLDAAPPELPELAVTFPDALQRLCPTFFLEPDFHVITSAGWSNTYEGVENVARALVAGGSPDVAVSAVRGSNLMGILEFLVADGLRMDNVDTGAPWRTLRAPILAADLQLGAGPLVTALAEGARVIMAGCYDSASPAVAMSVRRFGWSWKDHDRLSGAAAAARAAVWPNRLATQELPSAGLLPASLSHPRIALDADGSFTVDVGHPVETADAQGLLEWLRAGRPQDLSHRHADVQFDASQASVTRTGPTQLRVIGCTGARPDDHWRVEVLYQKGFVAETMLEFSPAASAMFRRQIAEAFQSQFVDADDEHSLVSVQEFAAVDGEGPTSTWLHLACRSKIRRPCADFVTSVSQLAASHRELVRLPTGRPAVLFDCGLWPARAPRGAIDIAVDTRPAREWE